MANEEMSHPVERADGNTHPCSYGTVLTRMFKKCRGYKVFGVADLIKRHRRFDQVVHGCFCVTHMQVQQRSRHR
jgi:hypothetical protein